MEQLLQFLFDNKQWLFSGIGVAFIVGAIRFFMARDPQKQIIKAGNSSTNIQTGNSSTITLSSINHISDNQPTTPIKISDKGGHNRSIRISAGDYQEFTWGCRTIRVEILEIKKEKFYLASLHGEKEQYGAVIKVSTGGGLVYGGSDCKEVGVNQYLVPPNDLDDEEPSSVYAYHVGKDYFDFFRIFVDHINPQTHQVTLNLFFADINIKSS